MVERFNGRIGDVLNTHHFNSGQDMRQTLERYVHLYNHQLPQSALQSRTPIQAMRDWYDEKPELFYRKPDLSNRTGCDTGPDPGDWRAFASEYPSGHGH